MFRKVFFLTNRDCKGVTLVELLVALTIMASLVAVMVSSIMVMDTTAGKGRNRVYAISQVRNAQLWIQRDGKMARDVIINTATPSGLPLTLTWSEWSGTRHEVNYYLEDNYLMRSYSEATASGSETTSHHTMIADSIVQGSPHTTCQYGTGAKEGELIFTITVSEGSGKYENTALRVFDIRPRPGT